MISKKSPFSFEARIASIVSELIVFASKSMAWPRSIKRFSVAGVDALLGVAAVWMAFSLRLGEWHAPQAAFAVFTVAMLGLWFPIALLRGVYRTIFRFSGRGAITAILAAVAITALPLIAVFMAVPQTDVPRTIAILGPLLFFLLVSLSRIIGRYVMVDLFSDHLAHGEQIKRVMIYGAGATGQRLGQALEVEAGMRLVAFVDDDREKAGHMLDGVRVHHSSQIAEIIAKHQVSDILIAITNVSFSRRKQIVSALEALPVNVQTLPPMREVLDGRISAAALRPVEVEDLLGRAVVPVCADLLAREITGKLVMVTGAGGSIGSEICRQILAQKPAGLVMVECNEYALFTIGRELDGVLDSIEQDAGGHRPKIYQRLADVSSPQAIRHLFSEFSPHIIFHAAAYKHVPMVEDNVIEAVRNNVMGTRVMAQAAINADVQRFVLISTDKAVRPPNVMGASKRVCEIVLQDLARRQFRARSGAQSHDLDGPHFATQGNTIFSMVRFGNVLGSSGSVVPIFQRQIEKGGPITVTHCEVTRYFMTIFEAAQLVIQAGAMARGGEVFLLDMGEPVKIWDLAHSMVRLTGLEVRDNNNPDGDIAIVESGLRPGEKLFEELLLGENSAATEHPRIMQGHEACPPAIAVGTVLKRLEQTIAAGDEDACRLALKALVPTLYYKPASPRARKTVEPPLTTGPLTTNVRKPVEGAIKPRLDVSSATLG
ncbi:MAG: nucleoside-diphosphate sugar epimerase/dehydratase [Pseudomonadota bacterium]